MAQEIDLIFESLREIKRANSANSESFERLLVSVANKLEILDKNSASAELIKSYLSDLAKMSDDKYKTTLDKFSDIEKALKAIFNEQDEHVKTKEMKELFEIFSNNMNTVYSEIRQQKALIAGIENKIAEISSNKSDKEDILRTISLLRNDFENINQSYKYTIDSVSSNLKNIISGIAQINQTNNGAQILEQIDSIQKAVSDIIGYLANLDKKNVQLETVLSTVATEESLKYAQSVIDILVQKATAISDKLSESATKTDVKEITSAADFLKQQLEKSATKDMFSTLSETADEVLESTENLKSQLGLITQHIENIPNTKFVENTIGEIAEKLNLLEKEVQKVDAKDILDDVVSNLQNITTELTTGKKIISDIMEIVSNKVLTSINEISFEKESYEIKNTVSELVKALPQKEDIERILDAYHNEQKTLETLVKQSDKIMDKVDNLPTHADMETLNSNQLSLVENLQEVAGKDDAANISAKIDNVENEVKNLNFDKEFESIYDKTSSIENWLATSNVKENAQEIAEQIKQKPNRDEVLKILETMENVSNCVEELSQNADAKKVKNTLADVYQMIEDLKNDFINTEEMHNDSVIVNLSELQRSVDNIVTGDEFNDFIEELREFLNKITDFQEKSTAKDNAIEEYKQAVLAKLDVISANLEAQGQEVKEQVEEVHKKVSSLQEWLTNSKIKENTDELLVQMQGKSDREDVLKVLKVVEAIVGDLSEISQKDSTDAINEKISDVFQKLDNLKTEFISTSEKQNGSVVEHLSEIQESIENIVKGEDFEGFSDEVKQLLEVIVSNTDKINSDYIAIKEYQVAILDKLDNIDTAAIKEIFEKRSTVVEDTLTNISEYLTSVNKIDTNEIKTTVNQIKEILESKQSEFDEFESNSQETIDILENYLGEIKRIMDLSDFAVAENVKNKLIKIEEDLGLYRGQNENAITDIISRLDEYLEFTKTLDNPYSEQDLKSSMQEISEIKDMILTLSETFRTLKYEEDSREKSVADFVTGKMDDLCQGLEELTNSLETRLQQGFTYNAALIEEKTSMLLEFIQDLRHENAKSPELYENLTVADSKLTDYKQELELINTDVVNAINSNTDKIMEEFEPIKEMLVNISNNANLATSLATDVEELHTAVNQDFTNNENAVSQATLSRLDFTYNQICNQLDEIEANIKDIVMSDVDSVMRQMIDLQTSVENAISKITPPEASQMEEMKAFIESLQDFKNSQKEMLTEVANDIKTQMDTQYEELKSLITVSLNNDKILDAIDKLKLNILDKAFTIRKSLEENETPNDEIDNDNDSDEDIEIVEEDDNQKSVSFDELKYQREDENFKTRQILAEVRNDYNKFADDVKALSGESAQIKEILKVMQEKMDNLVVQHVDAEDITIVDENSKPQEPTKQDSKNKDVIVGKDNFNFIQALDCFKTDVKNISQNVESVLSPTECKEVISGTTAQSAIDKEAYNALLQKLDKIQKRITSGEWLEEIKNYINNGKIGTTLELILGKLDILALTDSCDWVQDVKTLVNNLKEGNLSTSVDPQIGSMLKLLNDKVDILAQSDDYELFEELREILETTNFEQNAETSNLLSLINQKLDVLASSDEDINLDDLSERLSAIEDKINFLATSDGSDAPEFVDDMMYTLMNLEEKIDKFANQSSSTDSEGNVIIDNDIKAKLENLGQKLDTFAKLSGVALSDEVKDKLGLIENKIDVLAMSNNEENDYEVTNAVDELNKKIDLIDAKVDIVASTDAYNDIEDIKVTLENVEENLAKVKRIAGSGTDSEITEILEIINHKIDSLTKDGNEYNQKEFRDVKDLIMAQMDYIDSLESNQKTDAVRKCLKELTVEVNNLNTVQNTKQIQKTIRDMKESIMAAVVTVFEQVSFTEESEDIKGFVEEKTDEINQNLALVTNQLKQITNSTTDETDYTYSMQDIESDLAKLRLALKDLQVHEQENQSVRLSSILDNINQIGSTVTELQSSIPKDELLGLQLKFDQINSDIESLTKLSNHLLETSDVTYNTLNSNFEAFGKTITEQLTTRVDKVTKMLEHSNASDAVMRQALIYVGEWIDSASDSMNKISTNSEEIIEVKSAIETLKKSLPEQTGILSSLEEKFDEQQERLAFFERQITKLLSIEDKFEEQQERIDRLEMSIEKILSAVEDIDDTKVTRKIDKIDKQLSKLSVNIEKLASYVD